MQDRLLPSTAEVNLAAIERNYRAMRAFLAPGTRFLAVVKADAYGHGAVPVARRLLQAGAEWLGVATVQEGVELRRAGIEAPVLLLQGIRPGQALEVLAFDLTPIVFDFDVLEALSLYAARQGKVARIHVKVDTGMSRLGVPLEGLSEFLGRAQEAEALVVEGLCSHLAMAEQPQSALTGLQKKRFAKALALAGARGLDIPLRHLANSAATVLDPETHYDMVRVGIALYGAQPAPATIGKVSLEPALIWKSVIEQVRDVPPDTPVSYGATFRTERRSRIGVVAVGYADGYARRLSNNADVLVRGERCPVVGAVCMDLTLVDLTDLSAVRPGEEVVLLGRQGTQEITTTEMAERLGTISYEVLCAIGKRVPRVYG